MHLYYHPFLALAVLFLVLCPTSIHAHSAPARLLKRVTNPSIISLEILPRQPNLQSLSKRRPPSLNILRHDDVFRLILSAFDDTFHLHLRPNDHLIHPAARINYYAITESGQHVITHAEPLLREFVKAYLGEVVDVHNSSARMREDAAGVVPRPHSADLGWARIMVHHQGDADKNIAPVFEGTFSANGIIYHIMTKENYNRHKHDLDPETVQPLHGASEMVIWRESDVMSFEEDYTAKTGRSVIGKAALPQSCGHDRLDYNTNPVQNPMLPHTATASSSWFDHLVNPSGNESVFRRDDAPTSNGGMGTNFVNFIGQTTGCPTSQKVLYMGVAADCTYVSKYNGQANATTQILTNWNSASALYKSTFNVSLGIAELQVQSAICPTATDPAIPWNIPCSGAELDTRLSLFSQWRGTRANDGTGLWHLMSGCPTGSEVGIAWLATLCQTTSAGTAPTIVSGAAVSTSGLTEWQVVAHEIGHNFGAIHDCADNCTTSSPCCPLTTTTCNANARFVMSPVSQAGESVFSPCSLGNICAVMRGVQGGKVNTSCLVDPDPTRQTISLQMCGNGIVEKGEDCDPGVGSNSTCCDVATCKFKGTAQCDPENSACCTSQCTFAPATTVCRPSRDVNCDVQEVCTGNSSSCPADVVIPNGRSCGSGDLKCASGQCTSVSLQCQNVGASMGLKTACPDRSDQSCQISCQDPTNAGACVRLTSLLIDGSPCGFGGSCVAGKCQAAGFLDTAKAWYTQNLQISIPVTIVAALVAFLVLWAMFRGVRRCCGRRTSAARTVIPKQSMGRDHERIPSQDPTFQPRYDRVVGTSAQPGTSGYTRVPPAAHDRSRSGMGSGDLGYRYGANNQTAWVDDSRYNGPGR